jgi:hypothetical protein
MEITAIIDVALVTKPRAISEEQWQIAQEPIARRRLQLEERITDINRLIDPNSIEGLLQDLLQAC